MLPHLNIHLAKVQFVPRQLLLRCSTTCIHAGMSIFQKNLAAHLVQNRSSHSAHYACRDFAQPVLPDFPEKHSLHEISGLTRINCIQNQNTD